VQKGKKLCAWQKKNVHYHEGAMFNATACPRRRSRRPNPREPSPPSKKGKKPRERRQKRKRKIREDVFWKEGKKHDEPRERTRTAGSLASLRAKGRLRLLATREVINKKAREMKTRPKENRGEKNQQSVSFRLLIHISPWPLK